MTTVQFSPDIDPSVEAGFDVMAQQIEQEQVAAQQMEDRLLLDQFSDLQSRMPEGPARVPVLPEAHEAMSVMDFRDFVGSVMLSVSVMTDDEQLKKDTARFHNATQLMQAQAEQKRVNDMELFQHRQAKTDDSDKVLVSA